MTYNGDCMAFRANEWHYNYDFMCLYANGQSVPAKALQPKFSSNNYIEVSLVCRKNKCLSCPGAVLDQWCLFNFQKECIKLSSNEKLGKSNRPKINNLFWSCKAGLVKMSFFFSILHQFLKEIWKNEMKLKICETASGQFKNNFFLPADQVWFWWGFLPIFKRKLEKIRWNWKFGKLLQGNSK